MWRTGVEESYKTHLTELNPLDGDSARSMASELEQSPSRVDGVGVQTSCPDRRSNAPRRERPLECCDVPAWRARGPLSKVPAANGILLNEGKHN